MAKTPATLGMVLGDLIARIPFGLRSLTLAPWRPHRTLTGELESISALHARLATAHANSFAADRDRIGAFVAQIVEQGLKDSDRQPQAAVVDELIDLVAALVVDNDLVFGMPELDATFIRDPNYTTPLRRRLLELEPYVLHHQKIIIELGSTLGPIISAFVTDGLSDSAFADGRDTEPPPLFTVPAISLMDDPRALVVSIIATVCNLEDHDHPSEALALATTREQILRNAIAASKLTIDQANANPSRVRPPADADMTPLALAETYLANTPFLSLLKMPVPFVLPHALRFEHAHILGGTGHGKTQLIQTLILGDLDDPARPGVVAIDSQGDMVRTLSRLARFDPALDDRLIILDPADTEWPLALNMFDVNRARLNRLPLGAREQLLAGIISLYDYIFGALLGAELTQKQGVIFRYIARLMIDIPEANIQTLRQLMEDVEPFRPFIARLGGTTRAFFENEFNDRSFIATRQQIRRRLYGLLSNPTFERMFSHPKNAFDMKAALDSGKVVLINTAKDVLKEEASAIFGRFMIALVAQAALERAADDEVERRPAFVYIDEAADYFDETIDTLLIQARKYKVGITLAHQHLDQLSLQLRASVMTNPAIRFAGGLSQKDANTLDADMRTTAAFLMNMRKRSQETELACYVRNVTREALRLTVPLGRVEKEPTMSGAAHSLLLARVRSNVAMPLMDVMSRIDGSTVPPAAKPDGYADRY